PSVETLLHAFLPHRFIDHTHADVALVLTNQPRGEGEAMVREAFGPRWAIVPYVMPGFALAKLAAEVFERDPTVEGLVLMNHGLFTFADDARTAYERMIAGVDRAERFVSARRRAAAPIVPGADLEPAAGAARLGPALRGALAEPTGDPDRPWRRVVLEHRASPAVLAALARPDAAALALAGPLTPDHVIRTKGPALFLRDLPLDDEPRLRAALAAAVRDYVARYDAYFAANQARARTPLKKLDPYPRVVLVPGVGVLAAGRTKADARIAADIAEHTVVAKAAANDIGRYTALADPDLFDMEYWSLEQAKLGKAKDAPLAGQVALVTGGAGAIGFGIARQLVAAGAHVVVADLDAAGAGGRRRDGRHRRGVGRARLGRGVPALRRARRARAERRRGAREPHRDDGRGGVPSRDGRERARLLPRAARGGPAVRPPGHGRQRRGELVEERLRPRGRVRRLQRVEGGGAPARQGGGARAGGRGGARQHDQRGRRLRRRPPPLGALAGGRAGARALPRPRAGRAAGLLPAAEPAEARHYPRARRQRGRLLRLEPHPHDRRHPARRRRRPRGVPALGPHIRGPGGARVHRLVREEPALRVEPRGIAGELAGGADHAVARHDEPDRVCPAGGADGAGGRGRADEVRDLAVGASRAGRDRPERRPHAALEGRALGIDGDRGERPELAAEVGRERGRDAGGVADHARPRVESARSGAFQFERAEPAGARERAGRAQGGRDGRRLVRHGHPCSRLPAPRLPCREGPTPTMGVDAAARA